MLGKASPRKPSVFIENKSCRCGDLTRSMRQKGGCNIVRVYADAVIAHADRFKPAAFCFYRHGGCARIYRVFKQFFYDQGRPFHDLARSYAVCRIAIQHMDTAHFFPFLSFALICKSYNAFMASIGDAYQAAYRSACLLYHPLRMSRKATSADPHRRSIPALYRDLCPPLQAVSAAL